MTEFGTCRVSAIEDPIYAGANGALSLAMDMPESLSLIHISEPTRPY